MQRLQTLRYIEVVKDSAQGGFRQGQSRHQTNTRTNTGQAVGFAQQVKGQTYQEYGIGPVNVHQGSQLAGQGRACGRTQSVHGLTNQCSGAYLHEQKYGENRQPFACRLRLFAACRFFKKPRMGFRLRGNAPVHGGKNGQQTKRSQQVVRNVVRNQVAVHHHLAQPSFKKQQYQA